MTVTIPLVVIMAALAFACYRWMGLKFWHLLVCLIAGFLLAATAYAPEFQRILNTLFNGGHK